MGGQWLFPQSGQGARGVQQRHQLAPALGISAVPEYPALQHGEWIHRTQPVPREVVATGAGHSRLDLGSADEHEMGPGSSEL